MSDDDSYFVGGMDEAPLLPFPKVDSEMSEQIVEEREETRS